MSDSKRRLDHLFEVSWEVCNKVGGIHTVVATKALTVVKKMSDNYILIGPDLPQDGGNLEFEEDKELLKYWRKALSNEGIRVRIGRWKINGAPIVVLVDFTTFFAQKDDILAKMWDKYQVDSISGDWDYVESILFGYAAGVVIASYVNIFCKKSDKVAAHFHEWMTASGGLFLQSYAPSVATLFTTHATVIGRCIAGNGLPLYKDMEGYNADELAHRFNVMAKHSIEKVAAERLDAFLTVSELTANECRALLKLDVDDVTPNGFENDIVWKSSEYKVKRKAAREKMISVAEAMLDHKFEQEPIIIGTSGRYEYRNKGIDLFIESLKALAANPELDREVLVYITVPAGDRGVRRDLIEKLKNPAAEIDQNQSRHITNYLENPQWDPILNSIAGSNLEPADSKVKVVFVPSYLNPRTPIFECEYYELLAGFDLTVYASYYEPWGYTPLESAAFSVPTITTTLAGFGVWVNESEEHDGVKVIQRNDYNDGEVINAITDAMLQFTKLDSNEVEKLRKSASKIAKTALWSNLFKHYERAYSTAITNSIMRTQTTVTEGATQEILPHVIDRPTHVEQPNWTRLIIEKSLPERLRALEELSRNLWWCWTIKARNIFEAIDPALWVEVDRNPIVLLDRVSPQRLSELEQNKKFLEDLDSIYEEFKAYMTEKPKAEMPKIAYFSMEYGLHSSLKIYSGGLGILAGDYLKEASDRNTPMVAVGLLYRYGYFTQKLSAHGEQEASYEPQNFDKLPITPVRDASGNWVTIQVSLPGRMLSARVWKCPVGRTDLLLLDTDYEANEDHDRQITHHLYGGDWENRLKQEILLGIGGIRVLEALGIEQEVYHCNEGHAAFINVERMRSLIKKNSDLTYAEALEIVRSNSLFTTHTPVPAGHDAFPESMIRQYMSHYPQGLGINWEQYMHLGKTNVHDPNERFSMSVLACNLSQEINGVSWLHGEVSKDIMGHMWPGYFKSELHIGYVTNGVHFPTWVASNMSKLYSKYLDDSYTGQTYNIDAWQGVYDIPDERLWEARMKLKKRLINHICKRYEDPTNVKFDSPSQIVKIMDGLKPEVLTIGFARRFATYKRASLLFTNLERLDAIVNNPKRPVQFVFAGKAHPNDKPGQDLIKMIVEVSLMPQFVGKIIFLQNYDMELARHLVQGVDVWLNTPTRPLEASGTSGEKCVMNGVLNFSVLDGWWVEGYREDAGWMLPMERTFADQRYQNELDAEKIYTTIEEEIAPLYYEGRKSYSDLPHKWLQYVKSCIANVAPNFTMNRMLVDYEDRFYNKLAKRNSWIRENNFAAAHDIASWKSNVYRNWDSVSVVDVQRARVDNEQIFVGREYHYGVTLNIGDLKPEDVGVEIVVASQIEYGQQANIVGTAELKIKSCDGSLVNYVLDYTPQVTGSYDVAIRIYPKTEMLEHRMDMPLVKWA